MCENLAPHGASSHGHLGRKRIKPSLESLHHAGLTWPTLKGQDTTPNVPRNVKSFSLERLAGLALNAASHELVRKRKKEIHSPV
jgi:hypothetical protein